MEPHETGITKIQEAIRPADPEAGSPCLVIINGGELGKQHEIPTGATTLGRSSRAQVRIHEESVSRQHAVIENDGEELLIRDLDSTNGTYVNDRPVQDRVLRDGDQVKVGRTIFKFLSGTNVEAAYHDEIYRLTTTDGLTGIFNKRFFLETMEKELGRSLRYERDLSLIMLDIDHFKPVNDTHGHLAGDHILRQCAQRIEGCIRQGDILARYGGEEFILLLPEVAKDPALGTAERIRATIAQDPFLFGETEIPITLSLGLADIHEYLQELSVASNDLLTHEPDPFVFIKLADQRLYRAKDGGRNRVVSD